MTICWHCKNISDCRAFQSLWTMSRDFDIKHCANYEDAIPYKYKHIAEHDELMQVIYDYFLLVKSQVILVKQRSEKQ